MNRPTPVCRVWTLLVVPLLVLSLGLVLIGPISGASRNRNRNNRSRSSRYSAQANAARQKMIASANKQLAAAKNVLAIAEGNGTNAQARLYSATTKLQQAADEFRSAHSAVRTLAVQQQEIENEILDAQADDSPLAQAENRLDDAKQHLAEIEQRLLAEPAIKDKLGSLQGAELAARRATVLSLEPEYSVARTRVQVAHVEFDRIRRELFLADNGWQSTTESLAEARKDEAKAEATASASGVSKLSPLGDLRKASDATSAARRLIAQSEGSIRSLQAKQKQAVRSSTAKSSNAKKKKK